MYLTTNLSLPVIKCAGRAGKGTGSTSGVYAVPRNVQCWAIRSQRSVSNILNKSMCNNGGTEKRKGC